MLHHKPAIILILCAIALTTLLSVSALAEIAVTVDGQPVQFAGQKPVMRAGTVLVPLRGVFERLGASVSYDAPSKRVVAQRGDTAVVLVIGSDTAYVNGAPKTLLFPASVLNGSTMVPLRFVSEALGAEVEWQTATQTVVIISEATNAGKLPPVPATGEVTGRVTGVFPQLTPQIITIMVNGQNQQIALAPDVVVQVNMPNGRSVRINLSDIRNGDQVTISQNAQGVGTRVISSYGEKSGTVKSVQALSNGNSLITLDDGTVVELVADAPITMAGLPISLSDVQPGEKVVIRTNPQSRLGYGMAVATVDQPSPVPPAAVKITSFTVAPTGFVKLGDVLTVAMYGTPGGTATFELPGVTGATPISMAEQSAGYYRGSFAIPSGINARDVAVLGTLKVGATTAPTIQAPGTITIDSVGPVISGVTPDEGSTVSGDRPLIYATFSDAVSGVSNVTIRLDGRDVTSAATITQSFFTYRPEEALATGSHNVVIRVSDKAGNVTEQVVRFNVAESTDLIKNISVTPSGPYNVGDVITVTITAAPGGTATFSIGEAITGISTTETSTGKYTGTYTVRTGDSAEKAPLKVTFKPRTGAEVIATAPNTVTINAGRPEAPTITSPTAGASVDSPMVVTGKAKPNARVVVEIRYTGALVVVPVQGTIASVEVKAGSDGNWKTAPIDVIKPLGVSKLQYEVAAAVVDSSGQSSEEASVSFKRK